MYIRHTIPILSPPLPILSPSLFPPHLQFTPNLRFTHHLYLNHPPHLCLCQNFINFSEYFTSNSFRIQSCPDPDWFFPDPDPAKSFGSDRIRIHKTDFNTGIRTWIRSPNTNTDPYELGSGSAPLQSRYLTLPSLSPSSFHSPSPSPSTNNFSED